MTELSGCRNDSGRRRNWRKYISNSGWFPGIGRLEREGELVEIARIELLRVLAETYSYFLLFFFIAKIWNRIFFWHCFISLHFLKKWKVGRAGRDCEEGCFKITKIISDQKYFNLDDFLEKWEGGRAGRDCWERNGKVLVWIIETGIKGEHPQTSRDRNLISSSPDHYTFCGYFTGEIEVKPNRFHFWCGYFHWGDESWFELLR